MTDLTDYIGPDHKVCVVRLDADGWVKTAGRIEPDVFDAHMALHPELTALTAAEASVLDGSSWFRMVNGVLMKQAPPEVPIEQLREQGYRRVDGTAEKMRLLWITSGAGQALEYQASAQEAEYALTQVGSLDPADYPWLAAEQAAQAQLGVSLTIRQVAQLTVDTRSAWTSAGAAIKELRRTAKLRIAEATGAAQIDLIVRGIQWPTP